MLVMVPGISVAVEQSGVKDMWVGGGGSTQVVMVAFICVLRKKREAEGTGSREQSWWFLQGHPFLIAGSHCAG